MSLEKKYLKSKPVCKVKFIAPEPLTRQASKIYLAGDFNNWNYQDTILRKQKNGDYSRVLDLEPGTEYHYRFVLDGQQWENDFDADKYAANSLGSDNSVVVV